MHAAAGTYINHLDEFFEGECMFLIHLIVPKVQLDQQTRNQAFTQNCTKKDIIVAQFCTRAHKHPWFADLTSLSSQQNSSKPSSSCPLPPTTHVR